jgi:hypothetical protein
VQTEEDCQKGVWWRTVSQMCKGKDYSCFPDRRTEDCGEGAESAAGICKVKESRQINVTLLKNNMS